MHLLNTETQIKTHQCFQIPKFDFANNDFDHYFQNRYTLYNQPIICGGESDLRQRISFFAEKLHKTYR